ncbi:hypothetical protein A2U01_0088666, partial [Trifolium medium]|nr:hypothetical protein [Trifolium medium]
MIQVAKSVNEIEEEMFEYLTRLASGVN